MNRYLIGPALAVVLTASLAMAQDGPPPGGPRGGFGGGGAMQGLPIALLRITEVRKELSTTDEQNKQLDALGEEVQGKLTTSFAGVNPRELQTLPPEEQRKRRDEMRKKFEEISQSSDEKIAAILDDKQEARLKQLRLQREGVEVLNRPEVQQELALTPEQKEKLAKTQADARARAESSFASFRDLPVDQRGAKLEEMRQDRQKSEQEMLATLTNEQKGKFDSMKGAAFTFPEPQRGGFGGPGGAGPGGPGGEGGERRRPAPKTGN